MDINLVGNIASIVGVFITIFILILANKVKSEVDRIQSSFLFDKRIRIHLNKIDQLQSEFNVLIDQFVVNERKIKKIFVELLTEFESISHTLTNKTIKRPIVSLISKLNSAKKKNHYLSRKNENFFQKPETVWRSINGHLSSSEALKLYIEVNENYFRLTQIKLDKGVK